MRLEAYWALLADSEADRCTGMAEGGDCSVDMDAGSAGSVSDDSDAEGNGTDDADTESDVADMGRDTKL